MILLLGGTSDSLKIAEMLTELRRPFVLSVVSNYGQFLAQAATFPVMKGSMDGEKMSAYIQRSGVKLILDATHPFAMEVSKTAMAVSQALGVDYLRFERPSVALDSALVAANLAEACQLALQFEGLIYLTTGSKHLAEFVARLPLERLVARVLPVAEVLTMTERLGLAAHQIEGLKGPFSKELNLALLKRNGAKVMISKESGAAGGLQEKLAACEELGIPCIVIERGKLVYPQQVDSLPALRRVLKEEENG